MKRKPCIPYPNGTPMRHRWRIFGNSKKRRCLYCKMKHPKEKETEHKRHTWIKTPMLIQHRRVQSCKHCGVARFKPDKNIEYKIFPSIANISKKDIIVIERDPVKRHLKALGYEVKDYDIK